MGTETVEVTRAAANLEEEIAACHAAIIDMFEVAASDGHYDRLQFLAGATRLMRAQTGAATLLSRLRSGGGGQHTFTYIHQGTPPAPEKSKTNVPARAGWDGKNYAPARIRS